MNMQEVACFVAKLLVKGEDFHPVALPRALNRHYTEEHGKLLAYTTIYCINDNLLGLSPRNPPHSISAPEIAGMTYFVCMCEAMAHAIYVWATADGDWERRRRNDYVTYVIESFESWYTNYRGWMSKAGNGIVLTVPASFNTPIYKMRGLGKMGLQLPVIDDAAGWKKTPYEKDHMARIFNALEGADEMRCLLRDIERRMGGTQ